MDPLEVSRSLGNIHTVLYGIAAAVAIGVVIYFFRSPDDR